MCRGLCCARLRAAKRSVHPLHEACAQMPRGGFSQDTTKNLLNNIIQHDGLGTPRVVRIARARRLRFLSEERVAVVLLSQNSRIFAARDDSFKSRGCHEPIEFVAGVRLAP